MQVRWCHVFVCCSLLLVAQPAGAAPWTLETSIRHALERAPELHESRARIEASRAAARQAGTWPNPSMEVRIDDFLDLELGDRGWELRSFGIIQPLPWGRLGPLRERAEAAIATSLAEGREALLEMEYRVALAFHRLQRAQAMLDLAGESAAQARAFAAIGKRRAEAGDIARRDLLRLDVLAAQARQAVEAAEGEWSEAVAGLAVLLEIEPGALGRVTEFGMPPGLAALDEWLAAAAGHPALGREHAALETVAAERRIARSERLPRLDIVVYREYEPIAGAREAVTGAGLNIELPLWDRRSGRLGELGARRSEVEARLQGQRRGRLNDVRVRYLHLEHLLAQAQAHEAEVLAPARELFALTQRAYDTGEIDLAALIDVVELVRGAESDRQALLFHIWQELALLRADAGVAAGTFNSENGDVH